MRSPMHHLSSPLKIIAIAAMLCFTCVCYAQTVAAPETASATSSSATKVPKKMVQEATLNLQTTITGNQEQPRVLYILPWQSPAPEDVDFSALDNQQKAAFVHIEREELRRELEAGSE